MREEVISYQGQVDRLESTLIAHVKEISVAVARIESRLNGAVGPRR